VDRDLDNLDVDQLRRLVEARSVSSEAGWVNVDHYRQIFVVSARPLNGPIIRESGSDARAVLRNVLGRLPAEEVTG